MQKLQIVLYAIIFCIALVTVWFQIMKCKLLKVPRQLVSAITRDKSTSVTAEPTPQTQSFASTVVWLSRITQQSFFYLCAHRSCTCVRSSLHNTPSSAPSHRTVVIPSINVAQPHTINPYIVTLSHTPHIIQECVGLFTPIGCNVRGLHGTLMWTCGGALTRENRGCY